MKLNRLLILIVLILLVLPIAYSAPPWKKQPTTTQPTTTKEIIIINQTVPSQGGTNWDMVGVIVAILTVLVGVIGWLLTRKKSSTTSKYITEINKTYTNYKSNSDQCESELLELKSKIEKEFSSGKLTEQSFDILDRRIDNYIGEIRKGILQQLNLGGELKSKIDKALKDGKITKDEYDAVEKLDLSQLVKEKRDKLMKLLNKWREKK